MGMDLRVIGVLLLIPLLDVMVLVVLATQIGAVPTVALVVLTALFGLLLVRVEGRHTVRKLQRKVGSGELPTDELLDGAFLLVAGVLLVTPGIVTDFVGLILVLSPTRYPVRLAVKKYVLRPYLDAKTGGLAGGTVYAGGFPDQDEDAGGNPGSAAGGGPAKVEETDYSFDDPEGDSSHNDRSHGRPKD